MATDKIHEKVADKGAGAKEHARVVREVLARCGARSDCRLWPNNTGIARAIDDPTRIIRFGLGGSSDLLGIYMGGYLLAMEIKTGAAVQSNGQRAFEAMIRRFGGRYQVVRSADEAERWLDSLAG